MGLTQLGAAKKFNVSRATWQNYEAGITEPKVGVLEQIASSGGDVNYILSGSQLAETDLIRIPQYDVRAAMGDGVVVNDYPEVVREILVSPDWLSTYLPAKHSRRLAIITGSGDSMHPFYKDGDLLIIDTGIDVGQSLSQGVYFFVLDGELYVKELRRMPGGYRAMESDGKDSMVEAFRIEFERADDFQVLARVLRAWVME